MSCHLHFSNALAISCNTRGKGLLWAGRVCGTVLEGIRSLRHQKTGSAGRFRASYLWDLSQVHISVPQCLQNYYPTPGGCED